MKKVNFFLVFLSMASCGVFAQSKLTGSETTPNSYSKNALTVIILDNNGAYASDIKNAARSIIVPEKYDANRINTQFLSAASTPYAIQQKIDEQKIANQILAKYADRKGKTSKADLEKLKNEGRQLVSNTYIQILDIRNLVSMEAFYNNEDANNQAIATANKKTFKPVERTKNGWKGEMVSYLYRINPSAIDTLYEKLWIFEEDNAAIRSEKKAAFEKTSFETSFVMAVDDVVEVSQYNPGQSMAPKSQQTKEELFSQLVNSALSNSLKEIESQYEPFKIVAPIFSTHPLAAKIGKKEGLQVDQSFYIIEKVENSKGDIVSKHNSVIRVCKVADNTENSSSTSHFYQTSGSKIAPGMLIQQRNEIGLGISLGQINSKEISGGYLKLEENLAVLANLICKNKSHIQIPQLKIFTSFALDQGDYNFKNIDTTFSFQRVQLGISKGFYFARYFSIAPFISLCMESAKLTNSSNARMNSTLLDYGASLAVSISHNAQIVCTLNNYSILNKPAGNDVPTSFANRKGLTYDLGLRIEL